MGAKEAKEAERIFLVGVGAPLALMGLVGAGVTGWRNWTEMKR